MSRYDGGQIPPPSFDENYQHGGLASPRVNTGFRQNSLNDDGAQGAGGYSSSQGPQSPGLPSPYYSSSNQSLPRYSQTNSVYYKGGEGLAPQGVRPGYVSGASSRYSQAPSAHPLSHTHYADSDATFADGEQPLHTALGDEKKGYSNMNAEMVPPPSNRGYGREPVSYQPETRIAKAYKRISGGDFGDSGKDARHTKYSANTPGRLGHLDGLKFLASWIVLNGTFFDAVLTPNSYSALQRGSPLYIFRSSGLGLVFLLALSGRSLVTPLWDIPPPQALQGPSDKPLKPSISWPRLTRAMLVRPFRFILPVIIVAAVQWGLAANGATSNCNAVGIDEPYWALIKNFAGYATLVFNLFTYYEWQTLAGQTFAGNLWTTPWFFQGSYFAYVLHMIFGNLSSNRYWVYIIIGFFSWTTYNFFFATLIGLVFADLGAQGFWKRMQKMPILVQSAIQVVALAIACVTQFAGPIRKNINSGLATINVQDHPEITFSDCIFVACFLFVIESSKILQFVFGNIVMRTLGRLSAGIYLLCVPLLFTVIPDLALNLHNNGSNGSAILGITYIVLFAASVGLAVAFHFVVEIPSKLAGEVFGNFVEEWGLDAEEKKRIRKTLVRPKKELKKPAQAAGGSTVLS